MLLRVLPTLVVALSLMACKSSKYPNPNAPTVAHEDDASHRDVEGEGVIVTAVDEFEGRIVVPNYEAEAGDVTRCPYSGRKFEVQSDSPRLMWREKSWVLCSDEPMDPIQANPEKYLGAYLEVE